MKLVSRKKKSDCTGAGGDLVVGAGDIDRSSGDNGGGRTVVVGVRLDLDQQSKELLTWALVKVARPGDRVIALHVLHPSAEEKTEHLSRLKTFDSVLAVYEGFCNLKQVYLKLKICKGSSLRNILVREAKEYDRATLILGTCKSQHPIRSPASVAKYCARKLSAEFSVFAVDNGKVVFHREATPSASGNCENRCDLISRPKVEDVGGSSDGNSSIIAVESGQEFSDGLEKHALEPRKSTLIKRYLGCTPISTWADYPCDEMVKESHDDGREDRSLALVPYQPKLIMDQESHESKPGWPLIRRVFLPKHPEQDKVPSRKASVVRRVLKWPSRHSSMAVHPDGKKGNSSQMDEQSSELSGESGAIVAVGDSAASVPSSPVHEVKQLPKELDGLHEKYSTTCRLFTFEELMSATSNFMPEKMIGKGGSSQVYRGCLPDGKELAVKILKPSEDVLREFIAEIEIITTTNHKNMISLFGFCFEDEKLILVYDFLARGSLEENLHGDRKDTVAFGWKERHKVAVGVAEALDYLHNRELQSVIHRDIKSSNVLLSDDFEPQLADFGLATWASNASSLFASSDVAGTFGYLAPEYFMHGKVTDKIDVYAFGVVLLELLSGRKPIDDRNPKGKESLVIWVNSILKDGKMSQLLEPTLSCDSDYELIERMVVAATLCIRREPQMRPRIGNVLKLLQGDEEATNWAKQQVKSYPVDIDALDGETPHTDIQSHLSLALLDVVEDDSVSVTCTEPNISLEDYLKGRWSRSSSFD